MTTEKSLKLLLFSTFILPLLRKKYVVQKNDDASDVTVEFTLEIGLGDGDMPELPFLILGVSASTFRFEIPQPGS